MGLFDFLKSKNKYFETDFGTFVFEPELGCWEKYDQANDLYFYVNGNDEKPYQK